MTTDDRSILAVAIVFGAVVAFVLITVLIDKINEFRKKRSLRMTAKKLIKQSKFWKVGDKIEYDSFPHRYGKLHSWDERGVIISNRKELKEWKYEEIHKNLSHEKRKQKEKMKNRLKEMESYQQAVKDFQSAIAGIK